MRIVGKVAYDAGCAKEVVTKAIRRSMIRYNIRQRAERDE